LYSCSNTNRKEVPVEYDCYEEYDVNEYGDTVGSTTYCVEIETEYDEEIDYGEKLHR
jgi:hypothetical protein